MSSRLGEEGADVVRAARRWRGPADGGLRGRGVALGVLLAVTVLACGLGFLEKLPCRAGGWNVPNFQYSHACYTDIYPLYFVEGLSDGKVPYVDHAVEYPVLIGEVMQVTALAVRSVPDAVTRGRAFYDVNVALLTLAALVTVAATVAILGRRRRWDALMFAVAPGLALTAYINWDLLAVALTALAMLAWARRHAGWAGVALGLAIATKFYPLALLGPLFLLCLRAGRMRAFGETLLATLAAWLAVNVPVAYLAHPASWARFYTFNQERPADWGSLWYVFERLGVPGLGTTDVSRLNLLGTGSFLVLAVAIAVLALAAPRRPRLGQLAFLTLAAFLLTNKVWSPQYVLWLLPLVALARPRWPAFCFWQAAEVCYFLAIWSYLLHVQVPGQGLSTGPYLVAVALRALAVAVLAALVVRDVLRPEHDLVRSDGVDDPAGGVLDGARDRVTLRRDAYEPARLRTG